MSMLSRAKQEQILIELGEETDRVDLLRTMEQLDRYQVTPPTDLETADLVAFLKPILSEQPTGAFKTVEKTPSGGWGRLPILLQLVRPQLMLLSKWFVLTSVLFLLAGVALTNAINGNTMKFLTNAAPLLGILTVFFEFRAKLSGMDELEAVCPYYPVQLATARLLVVLGYDILLCLAVTPWVSCGQSRMLWQVMLGWFAPLLMMLGVALAVSLHFRIMNGCLVAAAIWVLQLAVSEGKLAALFLNQSALTADFIRLGVGILLLVYAYLRWNAVIGLVSDDSGD
jgi:hypothetical protein